MTAKKSTKTNNPAAEQAPASEAPLANTDQEQTTPTAEDTAAEASTPEPAASPTHQPAVDTPTSADKGNSDSGEAGEDPGLILTAERLGLSPRQEITAIIAGGVISGILARTKPYEILDLRKAAEAIGMCDTIVEMILHLDDTAPETPYEQLNS